MSTSAKVGVVIAAGGSSQRMNGIDKQFVRFSGQPLLVHCCRAFELNENVKEIVVVMKKENIKYTEALLKKHGISKLKKVVCGGETRFVSVNNGVNALCDTCEYVAIHDGARPLISQKLINRCVKTALIYGAAVPVLPSVDTLKHIKDNKIAATIDRSSTVRAQTPQVFKKALYQEYASKNNDKNITDDSKLFENAGAEVATCKGEEKNIKVTTLRDFKQILAK